MVWGNVQSVAEMGYIQSVSTEIFCQRGWNSEVFPNIHPPFKGVTTWHYRQWERLKSNGIEVHETNVLRGSRGFPMKLRDKVQGVKVVPRFPGVVFNSVSIC